MRASLLLVSVLSFPGCGAKASEPAIHAVGHTVVQPPVAAPAPARPSPPPAPSVAAPHGATITALAVSADGSAVVSADDLGGARLWPALDGSAEPRVVALPHTDALAIGAHPRGFAIAAIDDAGGLVHLVVDREGRVLQRASLPVEPAFRGLAMTSTGALAWRADHRLVQLAADGVIASELATEPGQRIAGLAAAGDRALVVLDLAGPKPVRRARWLRLGERLAWGAWVGTGALPIGERIAISPSGRRIASVMLDGPQPGRVTVLDAERGQPVFDERSGALGAALLSDTELAIQRATAAELRWIDLAAPEAAGKLDVESASLAAVGRVAPILSAGGGRAVLTRGTYLALPTRGRTQYLGYEIDSTLLVSRAPGGLLAGTHEAFVQLDRELAASSGPDLRSVPPRTLTELEWLGGDHWFVERRTRTGVATAVIDGRTGAAIGEQQSPMSSVMHQYEPTTELLALSDGAQPQVWRHDPVSGRLVQVSRPAPPPDGRIDVRLVSPALAGGTHAVVLRFGGRQTARWVSDVTALDRGPVVEIEGTIMAVDRAGRVYAWRSGGGKPVLELYRDGKRVRELPASRAAMVWPDLEGKRQLRVESHAISMYSADGVELWSRRLRDVIQVLWLDDGSLAVSGRAGVARFDPETGELAAARCGWRFGLSEVPHPGSQAEPLCVELR